MSIRRIARLSGMVACVATVWQTAGAEINPGAPGKVKVFILAGQSNMEGYGHVRTLAHLAALPGGREILDRVQGDDGGWTVRDDVFVYFRSGERVGKLGAGFGAHEEFVGPELAFGARVGELFEEPVVLIKTAWGGKDIHFDFRPPSAGALPYPIDPEAFERRGGPAAVGESYRTMVADIHDCLSKLGEYFPTLAGRSHEVVGFVWFQGWNEMFPAKGCEFERVVADYPMLYATLVQDLRLELKLGALPSVVGELGVNGTRATGDILQVRKQQASIADVPELKGLVRFVRTADLWDPRLDEMQTQEGELRRALRERLAPAVEQETAPRLEGKSEGERREIVNRAVDEAITRSEEYRAWEREWERIASHWECHYWGSGPVYCRIGDRLANAMIDLLKQRHGGDK